MADVEVRETTIQGLGVFAAQDFITGERVRRVNIVREVTKDAPIREELGERMEHVGNRHAPRLVLWGPPDRHVNHSCDPNAYEAYAGDATYIVARRPIATGQEITLALAGGGGAPLLRRVR